MATSIGSLILELRLDPSAFNRDLGAAKAQAQSFSNLFDKGFRLTPKVDHRPLTELNKHLDRKQQHWAEVRRDLAKPLVASIDMRPVVTAHKTLKEFNRTLKEVQRNSNITVKTTVVQRTTTAGSTGGANAGIDENRLADAIGRSVARHSGRGNVAGAAIRTAASIATAPLKIPGAALSGMVQGLGFAVTQEMGKGLSKGLTTALEKAVGGKIGSTELFGEVLGDGIAEGINFAVTKGIDELPGLLSKSVGRLADKVNLPSGLTKKITKEIKKGLEEDIKNLRDVGKTVNEVLTEGIGEENISRERLVNTARRRRRQESATPLAREQAALELRNRSRGVLNTERSVADLQVRSARELRDLLRQEVALKKELRDLEKQLSTMQSRGARPAQQRMVVADILAKQDELQSVSEERAFLTQFNPKRVENLRRREIVVGENLDQSRAEYGKLLQKGTLTKPEEKRAMVLVETISRLDQSLSRIRKSLEVFEAPTKKATDRLNEARKAFDALRPEEMPAAYEDLLESVFGRQLKESEKPRIVVDPRLQQSGARATYNTQANQINLRPDIAKSLASGQMSMRDVQTIAHELTHGKQFGLGSFEGIIAQERRRPLTEMAGTDADAARYAAELARYDPAKRAYELDARVRAEQIAQQYQQRKAPEAAMQYRVGTFKTIDVAAGQLRILKSQLQKLDDILNEGFELGDFSQIEELTDFFRQTFERAKNNLKTLQSNAFSTTETDPGKLAQSLEEIQTFVSSQSEEVQQAIENTQKLIQRGNRDLNAARMTAPDYDMWEGRRRTPRRGLQGDQLTPAPNSFVNAADPWGDDFAPDPAKPEIIMRNADGGLDLATIESFTAATDQSRMDAMRLRAKRDPGGGAIVPAEMQMTRMDRARQVANQAGQGAAQLARTTVAATQKAFNFAQSVTINLAHELQQIPVQPLMEGMGTAAHALGVLAGGAYKAAQIAESVALDVLPMGRTAKGALQHVALPMVAYGAATHFLPGGQAAAEGLTHLAQGALAPLQHGATGQLTQMATESLSALPRFGGIQQAVIQLATNVIDQAVSSGTSMLAGAGTALLGGRAIQSAATAPLKALAASKQQARALPAAQPAKIPLALPAGELQPEPAAGAIVPTQQAASIAQQADQGKSIANRAKQQEMRLATKKAAEKAGQALGSVAGSMINASEAAIQEAEKMQKAFKAGYALLKDAIKAGDADQVRILSSELRDMKERAMQSIDGLLQQARDAGEQGFGNAALTKLGGIKGNLTRKFNLSEKETAKFYKTRKMTGDTDAEFSLGESAQAVSDRIKALRAKVDESIRALDDLTDGFKSFNTPQMREAAARMGKEALNNPQFADLAVNTVGYAASKAAAPYGPVAELSADLIGALVARQGVQVGRAAIGGISELSATPEFKAASATEKAAMLVQKTAQLLAQTATRNGEEIFGDLAGFAVGNAAAMAGNAIDPISGIPMKGAAAASLAVPQLAALKAQIQSQIRSNIAGDTDAELDNDLDAEQQKVLKAAAEVIESAIKALRTMEGAADEINEKYEVFLREATTEEQFRAAEVQADLDQLKGTASPAADTSALEARMLEEQKQSAFRPFGFISNLFGSGSETDEATDGVGSLANRLDDLLSAGLGLGALAFIGPMFSGLARSSVDAAIALERLTVQFDSALGAGGAEALQSVTDRALAMRTDLNQARDTYLQFGAAVRDTPMENITDLASQSLSQAALVRGMTPDQLQRAQIAITQMVSKGGPIQSEEVRGQLAEALPGSTAIFARALGMSQSEFSAQLNQGAISGADAVPKFLAQLQAETSSGVDASLDTTAASITNLSNQAQVLQETLGKPLMPLQKMGIDALAAGLGLLNNVIDELAQALTAFTIAASLKFVASMITAQGATALLSATMSGLGKIAVGLKAAMMAPVGGMTALTVGIFAGIEAIKLLGNAFKDSGGEARNFADSATQSFEKYSQSLEAANGQREKFEGDTGKSLLEDSIIGSIIGQDAARGLERGVQGVLGIRTYGQKQAEDMFIARQDAIAASNRVLSGEGDTAGIYGLLEQARTGGGDLGRLASINRRMRFLQTDRNMLAPGDDEGRQRLAEEERQLRAEQARIEGRVRGISAQNASVIESLKRLRDEAEKMGNTDAAEQYSRQIEANTKAQDKLNEAISVSVKSVAQLDAAFERIQGTLQENSRKIDITAANMRTMTASNAALTAGQREFAGFSIAQTELQARIQANKQAIAEMLELLREGETQRVLSQGGFTMESSPAAIREKAANMGDSVDKDRLISAATQIEGVQTLTAESANLTAQLAESQQQARQRLSDLTREINDFYRQISRDTQEMALSIEQTNIQTEFVRTKTKIEASLGRLRNTFFDDLISGVTDLAGILEEIALLPGQVQGQIAGVRNQMQDTAQTAVQMHNQMPGGSGGATGGMVGFSPYTTHRQYFIDDSPVGSYDYTLEQNGNFNPAIPSPVSGVVTETGNDAGGYGNWVAVKDAATGMEHFFAHLHEVSVKAGQEITQGMALGLQGTTGSSTGEHVHHEIYDRPQSQGGQRITDRSVTRPIVEAYLANLERGQQTVQAPAPQPQAQLAAMPAAQAGSSNAVATTQAEAFQLAALAVLEAPSRQGRLDVVSNVFNRLNAPRAGLPSYGDSLTDVMFATGQYQPYFVDPNNPAAGTIDPARVSTMETAIGYLMQKREMSRGAAQEALNQVLADMANPQMMAESNRHVGGRLSFKGVQEYDNRVPSEDPLRQHGENFFHIDHNQTYDQLARVAALAPGAIVPGGAEGRPIQTMPHSGMAMSATGNPANAGLVNQGVAEFNNAANQQIAAMSDNQVARNENLLQQARNRFAVAGQEVDLGLREVDDSTIEAQRRAREAEFDSRIQTPELQLEREIFGLENRQEDLARSLGIDKLERSLEALQKAQEVYQNMKVPPELEQDRQNLLNSIREAIPATEQALAATQKAYAEESAAIEDIIKRKEEEFELAKKRSQLEAQQQTTQMQSELTSREIQRARNRQYDFAGLRNAAGLEYSSGVADVEMEAAIRRNDIEARLREATDNPELTAELQKQLELLDRIKETDLQNLEDQFNQTTDAVRMSSLEMDRRIFDSGQAVQQERASGLRALGLDYQAQGIEKQMAIGNVGMDLTETLAQIDQMQNSLGLAADQADALRQNAILLSEVRLDNINTQFSALGQLMPGIQGAFGNFFSQMIMGTTSVEDAFKGLLSSIAQQLADFAAKMLVQQLFGLILGKNGPGGAGGPMPAMQSPGGGGGIGDFVGVAQGLIGPLLGGLFGGGGAVAAAAPAAATGFGSTDFAGSFLNATNFTVGSGISFFDDGGIVGRGGGKLAKSIDDAMKREGANAQLIVASKGELILPVDKTREFYARGMDKILNFKEGGVIGRSTPMRGSSSSGAPSASVTVNVENKGRDMGKEDADKLGKDLEAAVMHTLMKSGKQGGFLYGYVKSNGNT